MNLTLYATKIIRDLVWIQMMLMTVIGDNKSFNNRLADIERKRREKTLEFLRQQAVGGMMPDIKFEGPEPGEENAEYSMLLEQSLSEMAFCRAVDLYHWYLKQIVLVILNENPSLLRPWAGKLGIRESIELDAFERGQDQQKFLTRWFRGGEWKTRKLVHEFFQMPLKEDLGTLVDVRNCIVHSSSRDVNGLLEPVLKKNTRLNLCVKDGDVKVGHGGAHIAAEVVLSDVSIIDQCLAQRFSLPTKSHVPPQFHRVSFGS